MPTGRPVEKDLNTRAARAALVSALVALSALLAGPGTAADPDPVMFYPDNYRVLLENGQVRVRHFMLRRGDSEVLHRHPRAVTFVITPFRIRFTLDDGRVVVREAKAGDVFSGEAVAHAPVNIGDTDASGILVEMKGPRQAAAGPEGHPPDWITAITHITGLPGREKELRRELIALAAPTRAEEECVAYDL